MPLRVASSKYAGHISIVAITPRPLVRAKATQCDDPRGVEAVIERTPPCVCCCRIVVGHWRQYREVGGQKIELMRVPNDAAFGDEHTSRREATRRNPINEPKEKRCDEKQSGRSQSDLKRSSHSRKQS